MPPDFALIWPLCVLGVVLVAAAVADVRTDKIHNAITYPAIAVGLIGHAALGGLMGEQGSQLGLVGSLIGLAVGFFPLLLAWLAGGIGGGDAKLMAAVGALTGWRFALAAMFYGFLVAGVMAVIVMIRKQIVRRTLLRVGRFVVLVFSPAKPGDPATADSPKIPFGLALCIGSALAVLEVILWGPVARKLLVGV